MTAPHKYRRPRRTPLSAEEVAHIVAYKKRRELIKIQKLKSCLSYKLQNFFNIACFCIYLELLFCFYGPCDYRRHYAVYVTPRYGDAYKANGRPIVSDITIVDVNGRKYNFVTDDFIAVPDQFTSFVIGKDFILRKELKGKLEDSEKAYRLFSASPILFLSVFVLIISLGAYIYNLNEDAYSLMALTVLNAVTMLGILLL